MKTVVKGACIGVKFEDRGPGDKHQCIRLLIEDDEKWIPTDFCVSSHWLHEAIAVLQVARDRLDRECEPDLHDGHQFGWKRREVSA